MTGKPGLEVTKWVAFALMLADHANTFLLERRYPVLFLLGRLVFPLFALCLAEGLAGRGELRANDCLKRLLLWACIAQVPWAQFESSYGLDVLFTLAGGLAVWLSVAGGGSPWRRGLWSLLAVGAASFCEYGVAGVAFVTCALWWRETPSRWSLSAVWVAAALLYAPNHSWFALAAVPVFLALRHAGEVPRARHWFYPLYAGQFVAFAFLSWRLA